PLSTRHSAEIEPQIPNPESKIPKSQITTKNPLCPPCLCGKPKSTHNPQQKTLRVLRASAVKPQFPNPESQIPKSQITTKNPLCPPCPCDKQKSTHNPQKKHPPPPPLYAKTSLTESRITNHKSQQQTI